MKRAHRVILHLQADREFTRGILRGIAKYNSLHGAWICYRKPPAYLASKDRIDMDEIKVWKPDGAFCPHDQLDQFSDLGIPLIAYNVNKEYSGEVPCISTEDVKAGELAAQHLLDLGHRTFAFCGYDGLRWSQERCRSFCATIEKAGFCVDIYKPGKGDVSWTYEQGVMRTWLESLPKPIGLLCSNDDRAESVLEICRVLDYKVPEDISVIGVDNDWHICELQNPGLSSVNLVSDRAGYEAASLLERMMSGKEKMWGQRITAPVDKITIRQSTNVLMTRDEEVRKALRFIQENAANQIQVADVVRATSLSHRGLNDRFYAECKTSIVKQLTRVRIDYISRLLLETDMRINEIADMSGYEDVRHISRYFKRATGFTPREYRRKYSAL